MSKVSEAFDAIDVTYDADAGILYVNGTKIDLEKGDQVAQRAIAASLHLTAERKKYAKAEEAVKERILELLTKGYAPEPGDIPFALGERTSTSSPFKEACEALARKLWKTEAKVRSFLEGIPQSKKVPAIMVNGKVY